MPRINVNLDDVQSNFALYPEGKYLVEIQESSKIKKSENGPYIGWIAKVVEGEFEDKSIYWMTSLLENALWNLKGMLEAIEIEWDEDGFELEDCFGKELVIEVGIRNYNGEDRNQVNAYYAA